MVKNPSANSGDLSLIPGSRRSPGEGNGNPLQYSCLENLMDVFFFFTWQLTRICHVKGACSNTSQTMMILMTTNLKAWMMTRKRKKMRRRRGRNW